MDDKVLKNKLEALKNSRKLHDYLKVKQNSKSASKPKTDQDKSKKKKKNFELKF